MRARVLSLLLIATAGCGNATPPDLLPNDGATYFPGATWRAARPDQVGVDGAAMADLVGRIRGGAIPGLGALVVVRNGYMVVEEYFNGSHAADVRTLQSVTKSVASLVTGIAVDDGALLPSDYVLELLPQYDLLGDLEPAKRDITIGHLLEMRSGINFYESPYEGSPLQQLNNSTDDWTFLALAPAMNDAPGARWQYNSGGVIALAKAVQTATGTDFVTFASERLFQPLGITTEEWTRSPFDQLPHTGGGLHLRATDLARIGYLVLRNGRWNGVQLVSEGWLTASLAARTHHPRDMAGVPVDYGYLWWRLPIDATLPGTATGNAIYMASGNLNNWLFVVPTLDLVVAVTGLDNNAFGAPVTFLRNEIIPATKE